MRDRQQVIAAIPIGREGHRFAAKLQITQPDAGREDVHLPAGVVDVVLTLDLIARRAQDVGQTRPIGGATAMAHVQRPRGVGRDELEQHALGLAEVDLPVALASREHIAHCLVIGIRLEADVDESGACDRDFRHQRVRRQMPGQRIGQFTRLVPSARRGHERPIGGEIAVGRIAGALELRHQGTHVLGSIGELGNGLGQPARNSVFQNRTSKPQAGQSGNGISAPATC